MMRHLVVSALLAATAVPAAAQWAPAAPPPPPPPAYNYGYGNPGYGYVRPDYGFRGRLDALARDIEDGWRRGQLTGREYRDFRRDLDGLYQLDRRYGYDGYRGYERSDLERRAGWLAERVRYASRSLRDGYYGRDGYYRDGYYRDWRR